MASYLCKLAAIIAKFLEQFVFLSAKPTYLQLVPINQRGEGEISAFEKICGGVMCISVAGPLPVPLGQRF